MKRNFFLVLLGTLCLAWPGDWVSAYQGGKVSNGGTIAGVVKFKGMVPAPKKLKVSKDKKVCAKTPKIDQSLMVSDGNLVNAVVYIKGIQKGKEMKPMKVTLDQNGCEYSPHVLAFTVGASVEVLNPDKILHNIHTYSKKNTPFNRAQPKFKKKLRVKFAKPEVISVKCDVHSWMAGWLFVAESPYYGVTDKMGSFKLTDVPPGTYTVEVWHETLGKQSQEVTVKANEETSVSLEMAKK